MVGEKTKDRISHASTKETIDKILRIVFITDQILRDHLKDALSYNIVHQLQVVVLQGDLIGIPFFNEVGPIFSLSRARSSGLSILMLWAYSSQTSGCARMYSSVALYAFI